MKLTSLTVLQKERLKSIKEEYVTRFLSFQEINKNVCTELIGFVYSLIKKPMPKIYKVSNPLAGQILANKLKGTTKKFYSFGTFLTIRWASFYAYYDTFVELGIITKDKFPKYFKLREFMNSGIFMTIEFEKAIILIERPVFIKRLNGRMHCVDGPAIKWRDSYCQYYINGRKMPKHIFENPITKEDFFKEENEEVRAGMYEIIEAKKEGSMLELLGAHEVDRKTFVHEGGETEEMILFKTKEKFKGETDLNGKENVPLAWLKMICPSTNATFLLPSDSSFKSCEEAAKYHRPSTVPANVPYTWNSRA
jgi:uncharacterized protein DUF6745